MSHRIAAYANGDDALIAWQLDAAIPGCLGFALFRRRNGRDEIVDNRIGWENLVPPPKPGTFKPSTVWPIQRFLWTDFLVSRGDKVQYRVVPMVGTPNSMTQATSLASDWTPPMLISAGNSSGIEAFFNRGIVMSQAVARKLKAAGGSPVQSLKDAIVDPANETRQFLEGELGRALIAALTDAAANGYHVYAMLFELADPQLIDLIKAFGKRAHVILSNGAHTSAADDENATARASLDGIVDLQHDVRILAAGHLAHNKFCVFVDPSGRAEKVWTGSQNWTSTGLCTQTNNSLMIHDVEIATAYRDQWDRLVSAGNVFAPPALLDANDTPQHFDVDGGNATVWFTPTRNLADLEFARQFVENAQSGILFLMFNPGPKNDSLLATILQRVMDTTKPQVHVVGVINQDPSTTKTMVVDLFTGKEEQQGNQDIIEPDGLDKTVAKQWLAEISRGQFLGKGGVGHAIVHSKVIVIDPFGDHPVVITGSHNLGETASSKNDENLLIIENDATLAKAYVVNIAMIHDAFRWRFARSQPAASTSAKSFHGLKTKASWQTPYFSVAARQRAIDFWIGGMPTARPQPRGRGTRSPSSMGRNRSRRTTRPRA